MKNTSQQIKSNPLQKALALTLTGVSLLILTACGNSKSNNNNNNNVNIYSQQTLARCSKKQTTNMIFNLSTVVDQAGQTTNDWIKIKFSFLSTTATASGNIIKFFKWRVAGGSSIQDPTPLGFASYDLGSGQTLSALGTSISASQVSQNVGYYIQLNDPNAAYQALKVVVYNSSGAVVENTNTLIPAFLASPQAYQYNPDGTIRATNLQALHPLSGVDATTWSALQLQQYFDQYCF